MKFRSWLVVGLVSVAAVAQLPFAESRPERALALEADFKSQLGRPSKELSLDLVMYGEDFFGAKPQGVRFTDDGKSVVFSWKHPLEDRGTYILDVATLELRRLKDDERPPSSGLLSVDRTRRLFVRGRTLLLEDVVTSKAVELISLPQGLVAKGFSVSGDSALVTAGDALLTIPFASPGVRTVLTWAEVSAASEGTTTTKPAAAPQGRGEQLAEQMKQQQLALFRLLFERAARRKAASRPKPDEGPFIAKFEIPRGFRVFDVLPSPAVSHAFILVSKPPSRAPRVERMPDYVTESGYTEPRDTRDKSGEERGESRGYVIDLAAGKSILVKLPTEEHRLAEATWSPSGKHLLIRATAADRKHMSLLSVDLATGMTKSLFERQDGAWILGDEGDGAWLGHSDEYVFISEASGFRNLHVLDVASAAVRIVGGGRHEIHNLWVSPEGSFAMASASVRSPYERDLVRIEFNTGKLTTLTDGGAWHEPVVSPRGDMVADVASTSNRPFELFLRKDGGRGPVHAVTDSPSVAFKSLPMIDPEIIRIPSEPGFDVSARLYRPEGGGRKGPGVVFVHGAGYLQNVHRGWSQYEREYGFHHLLVKLGFTVVDIDYRGSAGYGRDFRAAHKNAVGEADTADAVAAARYLVSAQGCDAKRIGIYGGSYGGFLTLMALFKHPGVFAAGAALRPVTDWNHYNEGYTANLLDDPIKNEMGWRRASPIWWADGLEDRLLICHGLVDDNVLAQDSIRLTQRLIELRKSTFELALYPLEAHGFRDPASWSDEYRRILRLFEEMPRR